ncbi:MAG: exodeoxyribonuclease VII large subunit [Planctomycetaceae bacterium]|jgi:exodeoxyribonuclease VII large subunit|nr:exodeoxyribonuclease VII large subunit [Planctomycetaceae bacterium]
MSAPLFEFAERNAAPPVIATPAEAAVVPPVPAVPLTIGELTQKIKASIESQFDSVWVVGEVSNLTYHRSGHVYLTLKDQDAQLPANVWKSVAEKIKFKIKEGMELVCRGRLTVFPLHGKYQLTISSLQPKGIGALELALQQLREKLAAEGLFSPARKRPLPPVIRKVAVITSPTGAAIRDFLQILGRRTQQIDILLVPVKVQGEGASEEIAEAVRTVNRLGGNDRVDCIVITRGGGSAEDLWAFNEEPLVRAVAASFLPVVSAVGHEIDTTLCDFAADVRTATPSEAAERISEEDTERFREIRQIRQRLGDLMNRRLLTASERFRFIKQHSVFQRPEQLIEVRRCQADYLEERLDRSMDRRWQSAADQCGKAAAALEALSPLAVLGRGYTLTETADGKRLQSAGEASAGSVIRTRFADGCVESKIIP